MARRSFNPNAPTLTLWTVAVLLGGLGILTRFVNIDGLTRYSYVLLVIGFLLLVLGTSSRRL